MAKVKIRHKINRKHNHNKKISQIRLDYEF